MKRTTIGGNRLGAGHKMTVEMKEYERSTHDLGYVFRTTNASGTLIPFLVQVALPGDTFDITLMADVKTHPTLGPLFGSFKQQIDIFLAPVRLYHSALMQNTIAIGANIQTISLPKIFSDPIPSISGGTFGPMSDAEQINPSALLAYLGIRGWGRNDLLGTGTAQRKMNAIPIMAYWDIYKYYYANKQENNGYFIGTIPTSAQTITTMTLDGSTIPATNTPGGLITRANSTMIINYTGTAPTLGQVMFNTNIGVMPATTLASWGTPTGSTITSTLVLAGITVISWFYAAANTAIKINSFPLTNIDNLRTNVLQSAPASELLIGSGTPDPYGSCIALASTPGSQQGLGIKTYQSDLFNNWMQTQWYINVQVASAVSTSGGSFNVDALILAEKVYNLLLRVNVTGGTFADWIEAAYGHELYAQCITPVYCGGLSKEVIFQEVVSTAAAQVNQGSQPLATLAGKGAMSKKHKGGQIHIKVNEHAYIIGIVSLTPRLDYSQGNEWHTYGIVTMNDFHKPALDQIGFQSLITEQMAWWDTKWISTAAGWQQQSAGMQPAWINYMTNYNKCYGNFALPNNEMFMTLNRRYAYNSANGHILDLTTYIDPTKYNFIFAQTTLDAQNFWTQIGVDMTVRRKMSAKIMPSL